MHMEDLQTLIASADGLFARARAECDKTPDTGEGGLWHVRDTALYELRHDFASAIVGNRGAMLYEYDDCPLEVASDQELAERVLTDAQNMLMRWQGLSAGYPELDRA